VTAGQNHDVVLAVSLAYDPKASKSRIQMAFPLGLALGAGVRLDLGNGFQADLPISRCTTQGCLLEGTVSEAMIAAMNKGGQAVATVWNEAGAPVRLPFSLEGFADAYSAMLTANSATK
jgi:invasion protein IalB